MDSFLNRHALALSSLLIALTALLYNGYRQEQTETNRNTRTAAFELLRELAALQAVTDYAHFAAPSSQGDAIKGWQHVGTIRDLAWVLDDDIQLNSEMLFHAWQDEWQDLGVDAKAEQAISARISAMRVLIRARLKALE